MAKKLAEAFIKVKFDKAKFRRDVQDLVRQARAEFLKAPLKIKFLPDVASLKAFSSSIEKSLGLSISRAMQGGNISKVNAGVSQAVPIVSAGPSASQAQYEKEIARELANEKRRESRRLAREEKELAQDLIEEKADEQERIDREWAEEAERRARIVAEMQNQHAEEMLEAERKRTEQQEELNARQEDYHKRAQEALDASEEANRIAEEIAEAQEEAMAAQEAADMAEAAAAAEKARTEFDNLIDAMEEFSSAAARSPETLMGPEDDSIRDPTFFESLFGGILTGLDPVKNKFEEISFSLDVLAAGADAAISEFDDAMDRGLEDIADGITSGKYFKVLGDFFSDGLNFVFEKLSSGTGDMGERVVVENENRIRSQGTLLGRAIEAATDPFNLLIAGIVGLAAIAIPVIAIRASLGIMVGTIKMAANALSAVVSPIASAISAIVKTIWEFASTDLAMVQEQQQRRFKTVFRRQSGGAEENIREMSTRFGMSRMELRDVAIQLGSGFTMKLDPKVKSEVTQELTEMAVKLADVRGIDLSEAVGLLQGVMEGSSDSAAQLGFHLSEARENVEALEQGFIGNTEFMRESTRMMSRMSILQREMAGDLESYNTESRLAATIISGWYNMVDEMRGQLGQMLIPALKVFSNEWSKFVAIARDGMEWVEGIGVSLGIGVQNIFDMTDGVNAVHDILTAVDGTVASFIGRLTGNEFGSVTEVFQTVADIFAGMTENSETLFNILNTGLDALIETLMNTTLASLSSILTKIGSSLLSIFQTVIERLNISLGFLLESAVERITGVPIGTNTSPESLAVMSAAVSKAGSILIRERNKATEAGDFTTADELQDRISGIERMANQVFRGELRFGQRQFDMIQEAVKEFDEGFKVDFSDDMMNGSAAERLAELFARAAESGRRQREEKVRADEKVEEKRAEAQQAVEETGQKVADMVFPEFRAISLSSLREQIQERLAADRVKAEEREWRRQQQETARRNAEANERTAKAVEGMVMGAPNG